MHGTVHPLCHQHSLDAEDGAVDAGGAHDDTLHANVLFQSIGFAGLRHTVAQASGEPADDCFDGVDADYRLHIEVAFGVAQILAGTVVVCGTVFLCCCSDIPQPQKDTRVFLVLCHRVDSRCQHSHSQDRREFQRLADTAPRDATLL